jgi:hypothetical protein
MKDDETGEKFYGTENLKNGKILAGVPEDERILKIYM